MMLPAIFTALSGCMPDPCRRTVVDEDFEGEVSHNKNGYPINWTVYPNETRSIDVYVDRSSIPEDIEPEQAFEAIRDSFNTWEYELGGQIKFDLFMPKNDNPYNYGNVYNGMNTVSFEQKWTGKSGRLASTYIHSDAYSGAAVEFDITINAEEKKWDVLKAENRGGFRPEINDVFDLQNTMTHEVGHVLGLDHFVCAETDDHVMCEYSEPGEKLYDLSELDRTVLNYIYGECGSADTGL